MNVQIQNMETKRLILRPIELSDYEDMYAYASNQENLGYLTFKVHESIEETKKIIQEKFLIKKDQNMPETWAIVLKENHKMIGTIEFHKLNKRTLEAEVGYIINKEYWNQGYTTEALKAVIPFGFNNFNLKSISAKCHPLNFASTKVMIKAGMEYEDSLLDIQQQIESIIYKIENKKWRNPNGKERTSKKI